MIYVTFFKPGPLGAFLGPTLAENQPKPKKTKKAWTLVYPILGTLFCAMTERILSCPTVRALGPGHLRPRGTREQARPRRWRRASERVPSRGSVDVLVITLLLGT